MTRITTTFIAAAFLLSAGACKEKSESAKPAPGAEEPSAGVEVASETQAPQFIDSNASAAWKAYESLRLALVASNAEQAGAAAGELAEAVGNTDAELQSLAAELGSTSDLKSQRSLFSDLVARAETYFADRLEGGTLYKQYCPMAFNNQGGYWLSGVSEIRNPYYGDAMLKCGKVVDEIAAVSQ